jgi:hypothetical protein
VTGVESAFTVFNLCLFTASSTLPLTRMELAVV